MSQELKNRTVKAGMFIGFVATLLLYWIAYSFFPKINQEWLILDRIVLAIKCFALPTALFFAMIIRVGSQRFGNPAEDPTKVDANSDTMKVDLRVLSNTHEQILVFTVNALLLSILLPYQYLTLLPIYSVLFVVGRIIFWFGYRVNVLWRAPGFAMAVLPAVLGIGYSCAVIMVGALDAIQK
jgi:hypothetical protein